MKMFSRIRNLREDKDLTQKEMAKVLRPLSVLIQDMKRATALFH